MRPNALPPANFSEWFNPKPRREQHLRPGIYFTGGGGGVPTPVAPPERSADEIQKAAEAERQRRANALGRGQTVLGGKLGEPGQPAGNVQKKTLLGE